MDVGEQSWERLSVVLRAFGALYRLPPEKVRAFLDAYQIFDHDWADEDELIGTMGPGYYNEVREKLIDYYAVLNHLCSLGQIEKMYIPPAMDLSQSVSANQRLFEQKMSRDLRLKPGSHVLDIGCGRGRIAADLAAYSGASIYGINIDPGQIANAQRLAVKRKLAGQCQFKVADMNDLPLPFPDNSFDAVYQVQAFSYARDLGSIFKEIHRLLKPGARAASLDFVHLPAYDKHNPDHAALMKAVRPLLGAIGSPDAQHFTSMVRNAGFDIVMNENASINGLQAPLIESTDRFFTRVALLLKLLVAGRILPMHFKILFDRLTEGGQAFVEADRLRILTTSYYVVAQKPVGSG